jgi:hypothetical protein
MEISSIVGHVLVVRPKHDKMWVGCALGSTSRNILKNGVMMQVF